MGWEMPYNLYYPGDRGVPNHPNRGTIQKRIDPMIRDEMKVHHWGQAEHAFRFRRCARPSSNSGPVVHKALCDPVAAVPQHATRRL